MGLLALHRISVGRPLDRRQLVGSAWHRNPASVPFSSKDGRAATAVADPLLALFIERCATARTTVPQKLADQAHQSIPEWRTSLCNAPSPSGLRTLPDCHVKARNIATNRATRGQSVGDQPVTNPRLVDNQLGSAGLLLQLLAKRANRYAQIFGLPGVRRPPDCPQQLIVR